MALTNFPEETLESYIAHELGITSLEELPVHIGRQADRIRELLTSDEFVTGCLEYILNPERYIWGVFGCGGVVGFESFDSFSVTELGEGDRTQEVIDGFDRVIRAGDEKMRFPARVIAVPWLNVRGHYYGPEEEGILSKALAIERNQFWEKKPSVELTWTIYKETHESIILRSFPQLGDQLKEYVNLRGKEFPLEEPRIHNIWPEFPLYETKRISGLERYLRKVMLRSFSEVLSSLPQALNFRTKKESYALFEQYGLEYAGLMSRITEESNSRARFSLRDVRALFLRDYFTKERCKEELTKVKDAAIKRYGAASDSARHSGDLYNKSLSDDRFNQAYNWVVERLNRDSK